MDRLPPSLSAATHLFLEHCRIGKRLADNTLRAYRIDLADFVRFAGARVEPADVARETIQKYLAVLTDERGLKRSSVKRRIAALKKHAEAIVDMLESLQRQQGRPPGFATR